MYPRFYKNILSFDRFQSLQDDLGQWTLTASTTPSGENAFWGISENKHIANVYMAASYVSLRIRDVVGGRPVLFRYRCNGATTNQAGSTFHDDALQDNFVSFVYYTSPHWNTQWGGETVILDDKGEYQYSPYIPNGGVLFPSRWQHYGASPNSHCPEFRTSIGFIFEIC